MVPGGYNIIGNGGSRYLLHHYYLPFRRFVLAAYDFLLFLTFSHLCSFDNFSTVPCYQSKPEVHPFRWHSLDLYSSTFRHGHFPTLVTCNRRCELYLRGIWAFLKFNRMPCAFIKVKIGPVTPGPPSRAPSYRKYLIIYLFPPKSEGHHCRYRGCKLKV